ncbi:ephexin-1-like, partial [Centruroides sculpturatus]
MLWQKEKSEDQSKMENLYENINEDRPQLKSQLSAMELIEYHSSGQRTLWCEVPEVQKSGILSTLSIQERSLQEALFEVVTSEASYLKSLNILIEHFIRCPEFSDEFSPKCVLNRQERHTLFSDVFPVKEVSERLLADLENHWKENIMLIDVCDILHNYALRDFSVYVRYCSNQIHQERKLKVL